MCGDAANCKYCGSESMSIKMKISCYQLQFLLKPIEVKKSKFCNFYSSSGTFLRMKNKKKIKNCNPINFNIYLETFMTFCWVITNSTLLIIKFSGCMLWIRRTQWFLGYASTIANWMSWYSYRSCFCKWMCRWAHMVFRGQINLGCCHGNDIGNAPCNYKEEKLL